MTPTDEMAAFYRACLDEDERVAREATVSPWRWGPRLGKLSWELSGPSAPFGGTVLAVNDAGCPSTHDANHIARHDPARVLAGVKAGRLILDAYADATHMERVTGETGDDAKWDWMFKREALENVVHLLVQARAGEPGWREEWAQ